jgi:hypothetical protein
MTKTQKRLALAVSVFVFIASGLAACIWLSGYDHRCDGLGMAAFCAFFASSFFAVMAFDLSGTFFRE